MDLQQHGDELKRGEKPPSISLSHWAVPSVQASVPGHCRHHQDGGPCGAAGLCHRRASSPSSSLRQLGEMVVEEPVAGSFSHLPTSTGVTLPASLRLELLGALLLVSMAELTARSVSMSSTGGPRSRPGCRRPSSC